MAIYYSVDSGAPSGMVWDRENAVWVDDAIPQVGYLETYYDQIPATDDEGNYTYDDGALVMVDDTDNPHTEWVPGQDELISLPDIAALVAALKYYGFPLGEYTPAEDKIAAIQAQYAPELDILRQSYQAATLLADSASATEIQAEYQAMLDQMTADINAVQSA